MALDKAIRLSTTFADVGFFIGINSLQPSQHKASKNPAQAKTLIFHRRKIKNNECEQLGLGVAFFPNYGPHNILNSMYGGQEKIKAICMFLFFSLFVAFDSGKLELTTYLLLRGM